MLCTINAPFGVVVMCFIMLYPLHIILVDIMCLDDVIISGGPLSKSDPLDL
jgi:hypothetical protein